MKVLVLALLGWLLAPGMYLVIGVLSWAGMEVQTSLLVASPLGLGALLCWFATFILLLRPSQWLHHPIKALLGLLLLVPPLLLGIACVYAISIGGV